MVILFTSLERGGRETKRYRRAFEKIGGSDRTGRIYINEIGVRGGVHQPD